MSKKKSISRTDNRRVSIGILTFDEAKALGMSSSLVRTISRSLDRLSRECFQRVRAEDFTPRWPEGETETKASLTDAGKINQQNAFAMRDLARDLKRAGL